jgi:hypothetical protein
MASPRTVHFQRSFSQVSACDGHLGGPNTRVPEEVTCSECWEIVKDQARRRGELEREASGYVGGWCSPELELEERKKSILRVVQDELSKIDINPTGPEQFDRILHLIQFLRESLSS